MKRAAPHPFTLLDLAAAPLIGWQIWALALSTMLLKPAPEEAEVIDLAQARRKRLVWK